MKLFLSYGSTTLALDGADVVAPIQGARYSPGSGSRAFDDQGRQVITETLTLELAGSYRQITDLVATLSTLFHSVALGARHQSNRLMLCVQEPDDATAAWYAQILSAALSLDPSGLAQRQLGQQLLSLTLTRLDEWEHTGDTLSLYFPAGAFYGAQNYILNHLDTGYLHSNVLTVPATLISGDLPAKAFFRFGINQAGHALGDVLMGCGWPDQASHQSAFTTAWEGENFNEGANATKTLTSGAADCSGGAYATFSWSSTTEAQLGLALVSFGDWWHGRPLKPLLRLQASRAYPDLFLKLKVLVEGTAAVVYETDWVQYQAGTNFVEFPPLFCPPEGLTDAATVEVALYALKATAGSYSLPLDVLQLWPVDGGFRRLKALTYAAGVQYLVDNGYSDQVYWAGQYYTPIKPAVAGQGPRLRLLPGRLNVLYFLNLTSGTTWTIDDQITVDLAVNFLKQNL